MKKVLTGIILVCAAGALLVGCSKKETTDSIYTELSEKTSGISSINYDTNIQLELESNVYGEKMRMMYKGSISTDRLLGTSEIHSFSDYSTQAFEDKYSEQIETFIKSDGSTYTQYSTFDGKQYYKLGSKREQDDDKVGPLGLFKYIFDSANTTDLSWEYINGKKENGYIVSSIMTGDFLKYTIDKTSMKGLVDFKNTLNEKVSAKAVLNLDKDKNPKSLKLTFKDTGNTFPTILGGMDKDSVETEMKEFVIDISFNTINGISEIVLPEETANAVETDNLDNFSVQVTQNEKLESETYHKYKAGNLGYEIPSNWEKTTAGIIKDLYSSGGKPTVKKEYKHMYSTSTISLIGGRPVFNSDGTNEYGLTPDENNENEDSGENTEETQVVFKIDPRVYLEAKLEALKSEYEGITLIDTNIPYIIGNKTEDGYKVYGLYICDGADYFDITVHFDDSNLYKDYYDETLNHLIESLELLAGTEEDENYIKVEETEPERPEITTDLNDGDNLMGTEKNPYKFGEPVTFNIIDMSTGNIATETLRIKGILDDKIIVNQKLKEHAVQTGKDLSEDADGIKLLQFVVSTSNYSYTDESKLSTEFNLSLAKDGKEVKNITNNIPLGMTEMVMTENDKEYDFIMAFKVESLDGQLIKLTYADPDLGDTSIYMEIE